MQTDSELNHPNLVKAPPHRPHMLAACVAAIVIVSPAFAEEGGAGHYTPGAMATLIDLPPTKPGWVIEPVYLHYQGDVNESRALPVGGLLAADLDAPTGEYEAGRLANPGRNYWTFDPTIGVAYNGAKSGFNAAIHTGFSINTDNEATDYQSGVAWHVEASVQQLLPVGPGFLGIGAEAFYYEQITGDSGSGTTLGDLEGRTLGVGPVLSYVLPMKDNTLVFEARWLPELETRNRLEGNYIWVKPAYQF